MNMWILAANASTASLYDLENILNKELKLIKKFSHPESREKVHDLLTDHPGKFKTDFNARGSFEKADPKEIEADRFAKELAVALYDGHTAYKFNHLVIVASAHFYGLLNKHINFKSELTHISKDYTKLSPKELTVKVRELIYG